MTLAVRFILAIMLIVGGLSPPHSASASVPLARSDTMTTHHHLLASGSDRASGHKVAHCLTLAGACCAVVQPTGTRPAATVEQAMVMVWDVAPPGSFFGQRAKVAIPPPRI